MDALSHDPLLVFQVITTFSLAITVYSLLIWSTWVFGIFSGFSGGVAICFLQALLMIRWFRWGGCALLVLSCSSWATNRLRRIQIHSYTLLHQQLLLEPVLYIRCAILVCFILGLYIECCRRPPFPILQSLLLLLPLLRITAQIVTGFEFRAINVVCLGEGSRCVLGIHGGKKEAQDGWHKVLCCPCIFWSHLPLFLKNCLLLHDFSVRPINSDWMD